jgi:flavin-dependent dehydrogenase
MTAAPVVIVGAGPAGAVTALRLLERGITPLLIERESFPRYHIGESLTGECVAALRQLGLEPEIRALGAPIKRGVRVYGGDARRSFWVPVQRRTPEGSLEDAVAYQVRRSDFDAMLTRVATERGARTLRAEALAPVVEGDRVVGVDVRHPDGRGERIASQVLIDASGQGAFMARRSALTSGVDAGRYDKQVAVFSQFRHAIRDPGEHEGITIIFTRSKHHWAWFIPLDAEHTSVGVVAPGHLLKSSGLTPAAYLQEQLATLHPELTRRIPDATPCEEVRTASNYSYRVRRFVGRGFLAVGDAHRFLDPIFSSGVLSPALDGASAAAAVAAALATGTADRPDAFASYAALCDRGQGAIEEMLDGFWDFPVAFMMFVHHQHPGAAADLFAGRIYGDDVARNPILAGFRSLRASVPA